MWRALLPFIVLTLPAWSVAKVTSNLLIATFCNSFVFLFYLSATLFFFFLFWPHPAACRILVPRDRTCAPCSGISKSLVPRDRTCAPCSGISESQPLNRQGRPSLQRLIPPPSWKSSLHGPGSCSLYFANLFSQPLRVFLGPLCYSLTRN